MFWKWMKALSGGLVLTMVFQFCGFAADCAVIRDQVLRVHILAHSDSEQDQQLKLLVRDAVVEAGVGLLDGVSDPETARQILEQALPSLKAVAQRCVYDNGYTYPVEGEVVNMYFTTRSYEEGTFPAGYYEAVRFTIGDGEGKNWWCVLYPPLCVSAATDKDTLSQVLDEDQTALVEQGQPYEIRFKVVEWVEGLLAWLRR